MKKSERSPEKKRTLQLPAALERFKPLFLYLIVGGLATLVEWGVFRVLTYSFQIQYLLATAIAFSFSTFANWAFGRLLVFKKAAGQSLLREIGAIYLASIGGLLLNLLIMFLLVQFLAVGEMTAKIIATILVFAYNYLIRKRLIYKKS